MAKGDDDAGESGGIDPERQHAMRDEILQNRRDFWAFYAWLKIATTKALIWGIFFLILWLLRDFFPLIFLTFVSCFVSASATQWLGRHFPGVGWKTRVVGVFAGFFILLSLVVWLMIPQIKLGVIQLQATVAEFPSQWERRVDPWLYENVGFYRNLVKVEREPVPEPDPSAGEDGAPVDTVAPGDPGPAVRTPVPPAAPLVERMALWEVETVREFLADLEKKALKVVPDFITDVVTFITALFSLLFLSTLFSFLIVLDFDTLRREVKKLETTKLDDFYRGTARDIAKFGTVLGKVLEAQAVIALVNAALTALGLWAFGIPNVAFLTLAVFVCGFIPVAGVFISSVPICLVGLIHGGPVTCLFLIAFITAIHFLEAYVLNPRIMGAALHINPVLVLIILVIGHHALGVWGLLLGLPICYYFFTHVIKTESPDIGIGATLKRTKTSTMKIIRGKAERP